MVARRSLVSGRRQVGPARRSLPKSLAATLEDRVMAIVETMIVVEDIVVLVGGCGLNLTRGGTV